MDMQLIQQAEQTPCTRWDDITKLIDKATDQQTKMMLSCIRSRKYHQEEYL